MPEGVEAGEEGHVNTSDLEYTHTYLYTVTCTLTHCCHLASVSTTLSSEPGATSAACNVAASVYVCSYAHLGHLQAQMIEDAMASRGMTHGLAVDIGSQVAGCRGFTGSCF